MIIEVVGVDGSGKTTLIHGLRKAINEGGKAWAYERSYQSENVRMLEAAASVKGVRARPRAAFSGDVIETARTLELVSKSFQLALYKRSMTQHVLCDSYLVEQGARLCDCGLTESATWTLLDMATAPDLCVYLKVDAGEALQRMRSRLKGDSLLLDADPLGATAAIVEGLERALSRMPYPHIVVDAGQQPAAVLSDVSSSLGLLDD